MGTILVFEVPVRSAILLSFRRIGGLAERNLSAIVRIYRQSESLLQHHSGTVPHP
jgi:hypothetical protein